MFRKIDTDNDFVYFTGPNPSTSFLPEVSEPRIAPSAFIGPFSAVIGDITLSDNVFVACNASLRADEGAPFFVGCNTNLQDGVILHGLANLHVKVEGKPYSVYIGSHTSCAHGSVIHGPAYVGDCSFIGVRAVVFNASVGAYCYVGTNAVVTGGVVVAPKRMIPTGAIIDTQEKADALGPVPPELHTFAEEVLAVNIEFPEAYRKLYGQICSCGMC